MRPLTGGLTDMIEDDDVELPAWPILQFLDRTPCFDGWVVPVELA
jgi:hypothetical protein